MANPFFFSFHFCFYFSSLYLTFFVSSFMFLYFHQISISGFMFLYCHHIFVSIFSGFMFLYCHHISIFVFFGFRFLCFYIFWFPKRSPTQILLLPKHTWLWSSNGMQCIRVGMIALIISYMAFSLMLSRTPSMRH